MGWNGRRKGGGYDWGCGWVQPKLPTFIHKFIISIIIKEASDEGGGGGEVMYMTITHKYTLR